MKLRGWARAAAVGLLVAACTPLTTRAPFDAEALQNASIILLGEQHDAPDQERLQAQVIAHIVAQSHLQALVIEMAEAPHNTLALSANASEDEVRAALQWSETAWPWARYRIPIMTAVRAGVPVWGGNLARPDMASAMTQTTAFDVAHPKAWLRLQDLVRSGHCGLLPDTQIPGMTRLQIAKDQRMAETLLRALGTDAPAQRVVLIAGAVHVNKNLGVPLHLPRAVGVRAIGLVAGDDSHSVDDDFDVRWHTAPAPEVDHCAQLRHLWSKKPAQHPGSN